MSCAEIIAKGDELTTEQERREAAIERRARESYESLTAPERVWYTVTTLLFCIRDGGLSSYFYNGYSVHLADCIRSLEVLGASEMREMLVNASKDFRNGDPTLRALIKSLWRSWTGGEERDSQYELDQAAVVEKKLDEFIKVLK